MKRFWSIFMLVFALVALSGPSLGMGLGLRGVPHAGEVIVSSDGHSALVWKCKDAGSKRTLPCHPDQGVLVSTVARTVPDADHQTVYRSLSLRQGHFPTTELPPPRLG